MIQPSFSASPGGAGFDTTLIERSAWFDGVADDLSGTLALGNPSRWAASLWVRFLDFGTNAMILSAGPNTSNQFYFYRVSANTIHITSVTSGTTTLNKVTTQVFRDHQWYHFLLDFEDPSMDFYVNGELVTSFTTNTENAGGTQWMKNVAHNVGIRKFDSSGRAKIYVAQLCTIDNKSIQNGDLTVASFLDTYTFGANGSQYVPKADATIAALATAAGGNSFCLTTAIGDGTDASGNGNNFTPTSMSDAANGSADTPSDSYALLNPLDARATTYTTVSLANGNLDLTHTTGNAARSAFGDTLGGGQWVFEGTLLVTGTAAIGWSALNVAMNNFPTQGPVVVYLSDNGNKYVSSTSGTGAPTVSAYGALYDSGDVIRVEADFTASTVEFFKNGTSQGSISISGMNDGTVDYFPSVYGASWRFNFGQQPFIGTPTAGFKALSTANRPTPSFQGADYFNPILYTGNGSTNAITGVGFQPDLVWIKNRTGATSHSLYDAVRGVQEQIESDNTSAETTETTGLTAFGSDGFTVGSLAQVNTNTNNFVGWSWLAGGAGASNTDGSITSTVSKAAADHFSIGTYTGNATAGATIGHGLGGTPELILYKKLSGTANWIVYSKTAGAGNSDYLMLDQSGAKGFAGAINWANSTVPTATVATLGSDGNNNATAATYVFYAFRSVPGICAIGSYVGTASATNGSYVSLGFRPRWLLIKGVTTNTSWVLIDTERRPFNNDTDLSALYADLTTIESAASTDEVDLLADGFKPRGSGSECNQSGQTFLFIAVADIAGGGDLPPIYGR